MSMKELMAAGNSLSLGDKPEGVSFDGSSDYLSRSSDLTGNADGKTFTFSAWVYISGINEYIYASRNAAGNDFYFQLNDGNIYIGGDNVSGTRILFANTGVWTVVLDTWTHILVSIDLANTANRYAYINDVAQTLTWTTYTNDTLDHTVETHAVGNSGTLGTPLEGRLAHVFLDYTYRDLSVEANRRLFIDSDGKPSSTIPSSPILYLPMTDAATAGSNSGTGGDFTVNGVLDTAGRAPNQWNCSASTFDGSADYILSNSSLTGTGQTARTMTFSAVLTIPPLADARSGTMIMFRDNTLGADQSPLLITQSISGFYALSIRDTTDTNVMNQYNIGTYLGHGQTNHVCFSIDLDDASASKLYVNGIHRNHTFPSATPSGGFRFNANRLYIGSDTSAGAKTNGSMGEFYWDDGFIDLSTDNPFWDADANRPKPVRQVISETGTTPLIALPLRGNDAGNNLGSGGDFTVNSGPFTGARGGSEFWARSANFDGTSSEYLSKSSLTGISNTKKCTLVVWSKRTSSGDNLYTLYHMGNASSSPYTVLSITHVDSRYEVAARNSANTGIFLSRLYKSDGIAPNFVVGDWYGFMLSFDLSDTSKRHFEPLNFTPTSTSWNTYTNDTIAYTSSGSTRIGTHYNQTESFKGDIGFFYFTTDYTDFSQESNRNLFVDQLGYPKDLTPAIEAGTIADPLIYMKFDDTSALGTNSGTGGNFTVNGTVTAGADVDPNA